MRVRYLTAMARERAAWRQFIAAGAGTSEGQRAYEQWQEAAQRTRALETDMRDAGLQPPDRLFVPSTSLMRRAAERFGEAAENDPDTLSAAGD